MEKYDRYVILSHNLIKKIKKIQKLEFNDLVKKFEDLEKRKTVSAQ